MRVSGGKLGPRPGGTLEGKLASWFNGSESEGAEPLDSCPPAIPRSLAQVVCGLAGRGEPGVTLWVQTSPA